MINATYLSTIKDILEIMVLENRITEAEMLSFLAKAGLTKTDNGDWIDEAGARYSRM